MDIDGNQKIVNADIAPVILRMARLAAPELQVKVFQDFLALLSHGKLNETSAFNAFALSQRDDWAIPLLDVLELIERRKRSAAVSAKDKEVLNDVHIMVASLINSLLLIPMITRKDGWKGVARFFAIADPYRSRLRVTRLLRLVLSNLMGSLKSELVKIEAAAATAAAAGALSASANLGPGGILGSPVGQLVSGAVSSIGSLGSTVGATISAAGASVAAVSSAQVVIPSTITKPILYEAAAHMIFFVEEFLYMMPEKRNYAEIPVPQSAEIALDAGDAHRHLRGDMHRASRAANFSTSDLDSSTLEDNRGLRKWKDFSLATQLMDMFDAFTATTCEPLCKVDISSFFGRERSHVLLATLRVLVSLLLEAPVVNDVKSIREKISTLRDIQTELTMATAGVTGTARSSVELADDFTRRQFLSYVGEKLTELSKQGNLIEQFYQRCVERCRILLLFIKQQSFSMSGNRTNDMFHNVTIHVLNQLLSLFKSLIGGNDPLFMAIGGHLRGIIMENVAGVLDSCLPQGVLNPFTQYSRVFEKSAPLRELLQFIQEILPSSPETMERLALATRFVEGSQLVAIRAVVDARLRVVHDSRSVLTKLTQDEDDSLQKTIRTHTLLAQKVSLKEAQRRVSRGYAERKAQDSLASLFAYSWKLMNDCSSVWRDFLIATQSQQTADPLASSTSGLAWTPRKSLVFTKVDKSEQVMRVRAKIKKNYRGKQHTEASFAYLKSKWKKDADELRQRQQEAAQKIKDLDNQITSPRAGSMDATEASTGSTDPGSPKESALISSTPRQDSATPSGSSTPVRTPSTRGGRSSMNLSKAKSKIVSIETEVDELMDNIDTDDFTMLDSEVTVSLEKNVETNDLVFSSKCEIIYPEVTVSGRLDVTKTTIYFFFERERSTPAVHRSPSSDDIAELGSGISSFGSPASSPPRSRAPSAAGDIGPADYRKWTKKMFGQKYVQAVSVPLRLFSASHAAPQDSRPRMAG